MANSHFIKLQKLRYDLNQHRSLDPGQVQSLGLEACETLRQLSQELNEDGQDAAIDLITSFEADAEQSPESTKQLYTDLIFAIDLFMHQFADQKSPTTTSN